MNESAESKKLKAERQDNEPHHEVHKEHEGFPLRTNQLAWVLSVD